MKILASLLLLLMLIGGASAQQTVSYCNGVPCAATVNPTFSNGVIITGLPTPSTTLTSGLSASYNASGTITSGVAAYNKFIINSDTVNYAASGIYNIYAGQTFGGSGVHGNRTNIEAFLNLTATTGNGGGHLKYYTALAGITQTNVNDGGVNGTPAANIFGINGMAHLLSGATFYNSAISGEDDVGIASGASVAYKVGHKIVLLNDDAVAGTASNIGISFGAQSSASSTPGWTYGISFGDPQGIWSIASTGTLIGAQSTALGGNAYAAAHGIDFSNITFSSDFLKASNFIVDNNGFVGVGIISSLQGNVHIHAGAGVNSILRTTNNITTAAANRGLYVGQLSGSATAWVMNQENATLNLGTNNIGRVVIGASGGLSVGGTLTMVTGELGLVKQSGTVAAPGAGGIKLAAVCGTNPGTMKIVAYAGTSSTPSSTGIDNVGSGVTGC